MGFKLIFSIFVLSVACTDAYRSAFDTDLYESVLDPELCELQLNLLSNHTLKYLFLDASGKIPSGISKGNLNDLGDYFLCLSIDESIDNYDIKGKYCTITVPFEQDPIELPVWPDLNVTWPPRPTVPPVGPDEEEDETTEASPDLQHVFRTITGHGGDKRAAVGSMSGMGMKLAVCVPKVCTPRQTLDFVQARVPFLNLTFQENYCRLPNDKPMAPADYVAIAVFSFIALLLIISTSYDLHHLFVLKRDPSEANVLLRSFSVYTNTQRFLTFKSTPGALECVDGIRAISMLWVIVGHTYFNNLTGYIHNMVDVMSWVSDFSSIWVISAPITVDTFFLLSGILAVYTVVGKVSRSRFLRSIHLFYLNRLLRMFPLLAAVVLLQASFFHRMSDGPNWNSVAGATENCRNYWWSTLLHVQNIVNYNKICLGQTWYLSVDIQLYIISPLVLVWLFGSRRFSWIALIAALTLSLVSSSLYSFLYEFSATIVNLSRIAELGDYAKYYYYNTLARAPPFFVGMFYGYVMHVNRDNRIRVSKGHAAALWVSSMTVLAFCIFSIYPVSQPEHDVQLLDSFLNAYMRAMWAAALGWIILACTQGYGGPINWFLSLRMWKLPARLSYAMYLIHFPIMMVANGSWYKTHYFSNGETMYRFMSDLGLTTIAAFILSIAIDAPFSTLQKLLLQGGKNDARKAVTESKQNIVEAGSRNYYKTTL